MGNFSYLEGRSEYEMFAHACVEAERAFGLSPTISALAARRAFELAVKWTYAADPAIQAPYRDNLQSLVHEDTFVKAVGGGKLWESFQYVIKAGNMAAHRNAKLKPEDAMFSLKILFAFTQWIDYTYGTDYHRRTFDPKQVPAVKHALAVKELKQREDAARKDYESRIGEKDARIEALERQVRELAGQLEERKAAPHEAPEPEPPIDLSEYETRRRFIDMDLALVGWSEHDIIRERRVTGMGGIPGKTGRVDYVLNGRDGRPLAIIEAKRTSRDEQDGLTQAIQYADCLEAEYGYRPLVFLSNGYRTQYVAGGHGDPRPVGEVFARGDMERIMRRRATATRPTLVPVDTAIAGGGTNRYYQIEAVRAACGTFERGRRRALLVMATGTGKTRVSAALTDVLMRAGHVTNVLFLADRIALVNQAASAYGDYLPDQSLCNMCDTKRRDVTARIVFSTYQTMVNAIDAETGDDGRPVFSSGHFDLIIVDEAHRSIFNKFRVIFDHFDALVVGLTATPRDEVDRNTYEFFRVEHGVPTYVYEYEQALKDGVLVPYHNIEASTKFMDDGIVYDDLPDDEKRRYEEDFGEEELGLAPDEMDGGIADDGTGSGGGWKRDVPDHVDADALNRFVMNPATVDAVLDDLDANGIRTNGGERLGKTIIFAVNQAHARYIVQRFGERFPRLAGRGFIKAIVHGDDHSRGLIEDFKHKPMPVIAVSVDMMDTGVDVPGIVNLVFFKKVRSKIKFMQMIGRGTRTCDDLDCWERDAGEYVGKRHFKIFDYCSNFAFFRANPNAIDAGGTMLTVSGRVFARKAALAHTFQSMPYAGDEDIRAWRGKLADDLHAHVAGLDGSAAAVRLARAAVEPFRDRKAFDVLTDLDVHTLVTDVAPLVHYEDPDEDALRFDALMYGFMVERAAGGKTGGYAARVRGLAVKLTDRMTLDPVRERKELIGRIAAGPDYLNGADVQELERVRLALRGLIRYTLGEGGRKVVITDLSDPVTRRAEGEPFDMGEHYEDYRLKVNRYVNEHLNEGVIGKLHRNEPLTASDFSDLEHVLVEELGTREDYEATYADQPFGLLVRSIAKLDHEAATKAFTGFINDHALNQQQIAFLHTIIAYIEANGYLDVKDLGKSYLSRPRPLVKLFPGTLGMDLILCIRRVTENALTPSAGASANG